MAGQQYRALYEFKATADNMLSFTSGEQFSLVRKTSSDWWTVRSMSGDTGLAPVNYLQAVDYMQSIGSPVKTAAYTSLYDYTGQDKTQLSFKQGDTLLLVDKTDVSWWSMRTATGAQGLVPVNYIDKLDTEGESQTPSNHTDGTSQANGTSTSSVNEEEAVLLSIDTQIQKIHETAAARGGSYTSEQRATLMKLVSHRQTYVDSVKQLSTVPSAPIKTLSQPPKSPSTSPKTRKRAPGSPRAKRVAPPPPSDGKARKSSDSEVVVKRNNRYSLHIDSNSHNDEQYRTRFGSLGRKSAPAPPNRRDSLSGSFTAAKPPLSSSPQKSSNFKEAELNGSSTFSSPQAVGRHHSVDVTGSGTLPLYKQRDPSGSPPRRHTSVSSHSSRTLELARRHSSTSSASSPPRYSRSRSSSRDNELRAAQQPKLEPKLELPKSFSASDGAELVESIRKSTSVSYRKSLLAISGVVEFIKEKVPVTTDMMEGLMKAVQESQSQRSPGSTRKAEASSDLDRLRDIFFEITECKNDSQQRGWAVHDDQQAIMDVLEELLQILCDANPDISKAAVEEDRYENVLTLITYYQMENRLPIRLLLLKVFGILCGLDQTVVSVLLSSVLPNELGRDIQQDLQEIQKTLYSCTVGTMIFSTGEAVPLPVYDQWSEDYVLFLLENIEQLLPADEEERVPDAFLNVILAFNQHFPDPSTNLVMAALRKSPNPRNFSEKLMYLFNRGEDPVAISKPCCPDSMTKFLLDLFSHKETSGLFYTTDLMVVIDIVSRQLADLGPEEEARVHYLELLFRIVSTTNYSEHKHRQHEIITSLNRIAQEENSEGSPDHELVRKIWKSFPGIFEEITDL